MKFNNPSGKEIGSFATVVGGVILGAMASRALVSVVHTATATADAATAKKESTMLLAKRGGIALASGYAGSGIAGTDTLSIVAKSACYGMAGMQLIDAAKDMAATKPTIKTPTTKSQRIVSAALGLGCASDAQASSWGMGRTKRRRHLGEPVYSEYTEVNPLEQAIATGAQMAYSN